MSEYTILHIDAEWVLEKEALGSKQKFWYRPPDGVHDWLFKFPRPNTGEHWAEKVAAEVAALMDVSHASVELAEFQGSRGSTTESFQNRQLRPDLIHGNEILAGQVLGYDPDKLRGQSEHTWSAIKKAVSDSFVAGQERQPLLALADYLVLDAVVGNTDRHHENWALFKWVAEGKAYGAVGRRDISSTT